MCLCSVCGLSIEYSSGDTQLLWTSVDEVAKTDEQLNDLIHLSVSFVEDLPMAISMYWGRLGKHMKSLGRMEGLQVSSSYALPATKDRCSLVQRPLCLS